MSAPLKPLKIRSAKALYRSEVVKQSALRNPAIVLDTDNSKDSERDSFLVAGGSMMVGERNDEVPECVAPLTPVRKSGVPKVTFGKFASNNERIQKQNYKVAVFDWSMCAKQRRLKLHPKSKGLAPPCYTRKGTSRQRFPCSLKNAARAVWFWGSASTHPFAEPEKQIYI